MPPAPGRDLLTEVLGLLHLRGELFCRSTFTAPWGLRFPARPEAYFRFVEAGACWIVPEDGREPVLLRQGDLALLPHGHGHGLCDDPRSALASPDCFRRAQGGPEYCEGPAWGGGGAASRVLCGVFHLERPEGHPLFRCMPPLIHLSADRTPPGMEALLALMAEEAKAARPGVQAIVTRLLEAVFIQALRAWTSTPCACGKEWLAALDDPPVYAALDLIHQAPEQTLDRGLPLRAGGPLPVPFRGAVQRQGGPAAPGLPDPVADARGRSPPAGAEPRPRPGLGPGGLCLRGGLQPRLQAAVRRLARRLPPGGCAAGAAPGALPG